MKTRLVSIGNSRGIRIPKPIIVQTGLTDEVELRVEEGAIIISGISTLRAGWAEAAKQMVLCKEDHLLDPMTPTRFDEEEWQW